MAGFGQQQYPYMYPGVYSPGQVGFNNNPEMSQLISMFSGAVLNKYMGPGSFVPHMMPTQQLMDQFALRNYQDQTRGASMAVANDNTDAVAQRLLGIRSAFTNEAPSELNREQAAGMARMLNNPFTKMIAGQIMGADTLEAVMHGSKGDVTSLNNTISRLGYFRHDPTGPGRMDADSIADFSRGIYAHMYEPQGNLEEIERKARDTTAPTHASARRRLLTAARQENDTIIEDQDVAARLEQIEDAPKRVETLYKKYVAGGKATDTKQQAQELVKFERAIQEAGVLGSSETTIGGLVSKAERRSTEEMHGFMAGQAGQIAENMFQRGMLPKEIGRMTAADRARLINQTDMDAETETRLSKEMARRDLGDQNNSSEMARKFRSLQTEPERTRFIEENLGTYKDKLTETRREVKATAEGTGSLSATDLEKLQGFDALAGNVDAKRSAEAIKKYTGAVDAIRDIFGDNGNTNAPLPALLAALEGLTGGAVGSMKPQKIESTLRQMQTLAKQAGVGFEQMAAMSTQIDSMGQSMGLTPADTLKLKPAAIAQVRAMQETGAFSNPIYGQADKGTATQQAAALMTAGMASKGNKAMAALATIYKADPKRFAGGELEAALEQAYYNPEGDGTYVDPKTGEKKNLRQIIAQQGEAGALGILTRDGGTVDEFSAQRLNPLAMENSDEYFGYLMQKDDEITVTNNNSVRGRLQRGLEQTGLFAGKSDDAQYDISQKLGRALTSRIFETSGLEQTEQIAEIQKTIEADFKRVFQEEFKMPEAQATAMAQEAAKAASSPSDIQKYVGGANTSFNLWTGRNLRNEYQHRGEGRDLIGAQMASRAKTQSERRMEVGLGYESGPIQNISDYLLDIGKRGENFTKDGFMQSITRVTKNEEILRRAASGMVPAFDALSELSYGHAPSAADPTGTTGALIGERDVKAAVAAAAAGNAAQLNSLAGIDPTKTTIVGNKEADKLVEAKFAERTKTNEQLVRAYNEQFGGAAKGVNAEKLTKEDADKMRARLHENVDFMSELETAALGPTQMSERQREQAARRNIGTAKDGQDVFAGRLQSIYRGLLEGQSPERLKMAMDDTLDAFDLKVDPQQKETIFQALSRGEAGKDDLQKMLSNLNVPAEKKQLFTDIMRGLQEAPAMALSETTGLTSVVTGTTERELAARYGSSGAVTREAAQQKAQETTEAIRQAQTTAKTEEEKKQAAQKVTEDSLTRHYVDTEKLPEAEARAKAQAESRAITQKTEAASEAARASGVAQRVDTLEVNAQTVVIKGGKFEGEKTAPQTPSAPGALAAAAASVMGGDGASLMDAVTNGNPAALLNSVGGLETITSVATGDYLGAAMGAFKKMSLGTLFGTPEEGKKEEPKPDEPLAAKPDAAPSVPAPEPEKVKQANETQMKHDTGAVTQPPEINKPQQKRSVYDLTGADLLKEAGGATAVKASEKKQQELLQNAGLLNNLKELKYAQEKGEDYIEQVASEKLGLRMRDAIASGLIPHPVDEDGDPITDFEGDEAVAAVEKHLAQYLPKATTAQEGKVPDSKTEPPADHAQLAAAGPTGEEKQYTADELAALHPEGVKDEFGDREEWEPAMAADLPTGDYTRKMGGNYVNTKTGEQFDRYGNPAGGTYTADGNKWTAGGTDTAKAPEKVKQANEAQLKKDSGASTPPSDAVSASAAGLEPAAPQLNKEQQRLQKLYKTQQARIKDFEAQKQPNKDTIKTVEDQAARTVDLLGVHQAAQLANIDTTGGALWDQRANTINGKPISREKVDEQIALMRERAKTDPQSLMPKETVAQLNDKELKKSAGATSANVDPAAAQTAQKPETATVTAAPIVPDAKEKTADENVQKPLATTLPNTETIKPATETINRVNSMSASDVFTAGVAPGAPPQGSSAGGMTINGTLTLSGLQEAILSAQGSQVMQTDGGPPVVIDPTMQQRTNAAPKVWG